MTDSLRESVSALVDGESNDIELQRLLAKEDPQVVRQVWADYQLQRQLLHKHDHEAASPFLHLDISSRVSAALESETPHQGAGEAPAPASEPAAAPAQPRRWLRPFGSVAVAASVAAAVVLGVQTLRAPAPGTASTVADVGVPQANAPAPRPVAGQRVFTSQGSRPQVANVAASVGAPVTVQSATTRSDSEVRERLHRYLLRHTERAALNSGQGMMSFARVASYEVD